MDDLKKYISGHMEDIDSAPLPSGSKERFMEKYEKENARKKVVRILLNSISAAAAVLAMVVVLQYQTSESSQVARMIRRMCDCEVEIMSMVEMNQPEEAESTCSAIRAITSEAIPLASLLPDELPSRERMRILREYYGKKIEALERVKSIYTNNNGQYKQK